jgi:F420-0:gamma-glutamyl ligase
MAYPINAPKTLLNVATNTIIDIDKKLSASTTIGITKTSGGIGCKAASEAETKANPSRPKPSAQSINGWK